MRRVEAEALVGARREEVWQLYDDIPGTPRWVPFVEEILYVSGPARVGCVYRERTRLAGLPATEQWEIVEHRPQSRQVHVSFAHAMESALIITFEARGTGTWVHQAAELRSRLWGPLGWLHELLASFPAGHGVRAAVTGAKAAFEEGRRCRQPGLGGLDLPHDGEVALRPAPSRVTWYSISRGDPSSRRKRSVEWSSPRSMNSAHSERMSSRALASSGFDSASTAGPRIASRGASTISVRDVDTSTNRRSSSRIAHAWPGSSHQRRPGETDPKR